MSIDSKVLGTYNASTTVATYDTLLFFTTQLDPSTKHQIVVTNQVEGSTLAIDYFVAVNAGAATASPNGVWPGEKAVHGENSSGVLVGGLLGGLLAFVCLIVLHQGCHLMSAIAFSSFHVLEMEKGGRYR